MNKLIEAAKKIEFKNRRDKFTPEYIELAAAYLNGEIRRGALLGVLKSAGMPTSNAISFVTGAIKRGVEMEIVELKYKKAKL